MSALTRRRWLNLGLLGLVGGLAALAWLESRQERLAGVPTLLELTPAQTERIAVERPGQANLAFKRSSGRWWMTAPESGLANPVLLNPIVNLAGTHCSLRYPVAELNLKSLQLDPPRLRLWLNDREIRFGATAPTDGRRYLQIGATVSLCPDGLYPLLTSAAASFRAPPIESSALGRARDE
ncbi:MAG: hypothetical protein IPM89_13110 [Candidatus Competibacteraceae bacterium]|nr:MAG: hypothetical protein IPM89_13110 [Candidatus Competibacteraceae bacterium]